MNKVYIYILIMALTIFMIRVLPLTLIRKKIKNKILRSFLFYVPYVTLAVMTFPAIIYATESIWSGVAALAVGVVLSYVGVGLFGVAVSSCTVVFVIELIMNLM